MAFELGAARSPRFWDAYRRCGRFAGWLVGLRTPGSQDRPRLPIRLTVLVVVAALLLVVCPSPAGAAETGQYQLSRVATLRLNPRGFFIGTMKKGSHFYYSGGAARSKYLPVYSVQLGRCGWIESSKVSSATKSNTKVGPRCFPSTASGASSRRVLLSTYAKDVNDLRGGRYDYAYSVEWGCPIRLSQSVQVYANLKSWRTGEIDPTSAIPGAVVDTVAWRYTVRSRPSVLVVGVSGGGWGFVQVKPNQSLPHTVRNSDGRTTADGWPKSRGRCQFADERSIGTEANPVLVP